MGGEPCVSGTRITVKAIRALGTIEQAMRFYPELTREQVEGAWVYDGPFPPDDEAIVDGACARLKVGPLLWMGHAGSVADDRGQWVASVVKPTTNGDAWVWSANRPFQSPASGTESTCRDAVMKMRDVLATWADVCARHGVKGVMCDQHYREAIREHLATHGLWLADAPEGATGKADSYVHARSLMREGKLKIPDDPRLLRQLRAVVGKPTSGGGISVYTPTSADGSHGDLVSALVLACWGFSGKTIQAAEPSVGTAESTAAVAKARIVFFTVRVIFARI
jgi:uncharacterized protein (DUF433 family)